MISKTYKVYIHREKDWYVAESSDYGTVSQGRTKKEAVANLVEATDLYLEEFPIPNHKPELHA